MRYEISTKRQMLFNILNTPVEVLKSPLFSTAKLQLNVLRLDQIHPVVSGNKLFKLHYFLEEARHASHKTLLTFGGAYSNHLVATAYACKLAGVKSIAFVRGEKAEQLSHTLQHCLDYGMQLQFISREEYAAKDDSPFLAQLKEYYGDCTIVPEGGYHPEGAKGAALIHRLIQPGSYSHICTAAGTATTAAGLLMGADDEKTICLPVLKGMTDMEERIAFCCGGSYKKEQLEIFHDYHFGGYAKKTPDLLAFMNQLWQQHRLPTDFVYTAKLFYGITDKIKNGYFPAGSNILCLHTGGLQGNSSLPKGSLLF